MTEVRFYHMERSTLESALPALLNKAIRQGNIIVKTTNSKNIDALNTHLWTFDPNSFLPHGSDKDGFAEKQPVWLTDKDENPNQSDILVLTHGAISENINKFKLCCEMLDGRNEQAVQEARKRWKSYKEQGFDITYWQQGEKGWEQKAA